MRLAVAAVFVALLVGCNQQTAADLAVCKSDLGKAQADVATAKTAQTAAEQKASGLEQQVAALNTQATQMQAAADEASKAVEEKAPAAKTGKKKSAVKTVKLEGPPATQAPANAAPKPAPLAPTTSGAERQRVK